MNGFEQIKEMLELVGIKAVVESMTKPVTEMLRLKLEEIGIEAEIKIDLEVKSVNLDTFRSKGGNL